MTDELHDDGAAAAPEATARLGWTRLAIGFGWGVALWGLHEAWEAKVWPATQLAAMSPLVLIALFVPLIVIAGLGRMRPRTLVIWTGAAAAVVAGLGVYDGLTATAEAFGERVAVSPVLVVCAAAGLFIAHSLVEASDHDRRRVASYATLFDLASKHAVQLALSGAFVGVFWALLWLGAALFELIGLDGFRRLLQEQWFSIPATFTAFAAAGHLTDVRVGLIRGVRTVGLTLLSWLAPMMALIAAGFLVSLAFTGLEPLWDTNAGAAILLSAAAVLILLVNAIYQGGDETRPPPLVLRWSARVASVALVPIVALAAYALALRVGQYGLTPERVIAAACVLVGAVIAAGYAFAAVRPGPFLKPLEPTNIAGAYTALAVLIALFTPLADPARLSVNDQVNRLLAGKVTADKFDWDFLRFQARQAGLDALKRLARSNDKAVAEEAKAALARDYRTAPADAVEPLPRLTIADLKVVSAGKTPPAEFLAQDWSADETLRGCVGVSLDARRCRAVLEDFDRDGVDEILVVRLGSGGLYRRQGAGWRRIASTGGQCDGWEEALEAGRFRVIEPPLRDVVIGDQRVVLEPPVRLCDPADPLFGAVK